MRHLLPLLFLLTHLSAFSQGMDDSTELRAEASFFSNAPSLPLGGKVFVPRYHPGIDLGIGGPFNIKEKGRWEWSSKLGYYYHKLSHHGIHLRGGLRYRQTGNRDKDWNGLSWEIAFRGGYLHMLTQRPAYEFDEASGEYQRTQRLGRSQFTFELETGPAYRPIESPEWEFFLNYRFWMQTPFVKEYVPILPNVAFHLGIRYRLPNGKENE